jgi:hypothetical protein
VPGPVIHRFRLDAYRNRAQKEKMARSVGALLAHFGQRGIDVMLIKGLAADITVYDQVWYTASGDVDLVLKTARGTVSDAEITAAAGGRRECMIEWECGEHHDVTVNGQLINGATPIFEGDIVCFGNVVARVHLKDDDDTDQREDK